MHANSVCDSDKARVGVGRARRGVSPVFESWMKGDLPSFEAHYHVVLLAVCKWWPTFSFFWYNGRPAAPPPPPPSPDSTS